MSRSWWNHVLLDSHWRQRADIDALEDQSRQVARRLRRENAALEAKVEDLEEELAGMTLFVRSLLGALIETGVLTPDEFGAKLRELDLEDGVEDGR